MNYLAEVLLAALLIAGSAGSQTTGQDTGTDPATAALSDVYQSTDGSIVGTVVDADFRFPIAGAKVEVLGTDKSAITGKDGQYRIASLPKGFYQVQASLVPGYNFVTKNNVQVESGKERPLFFELKMASDIPPDFVPVEKQPTPTANPAPVYPESARKDSVEGVVWIKLVVDERGNVDTVSLINLHCTTAGVDVRAGGIDSLAQQRLSERIYKAIADLVSATISAAKKWKFTPAMLNGKPVKVWVTIPFKYKLSSTGGEKALPKTKPLEPKK